MKYVLTKAQIKRLIDGKYVMDGRGRKYFASKEVKENLRELDENNLYDEYSVVVEGNALDILEKIK